MEEIKQTALQKAKKKYYEKNKEIIKQKVYQQRLDNINLLTAAELDQLKQKRKEYLIKKQETMTPEEISIKKQKQAGYKAKFLEKKKNTAHSL